MQFEKPRIVLVNKPKGISSNTVANIVKKAVGANKAGHLGTLDVAGEGLLPVTLNKATRLFDLFLNKDKVYKTIFIFGKTTDTLDLEGEITKTDNKSITPQMIQSVLHELVGKYPQMPPVYSAKKVGGKNAYALARRGEAVELKPKVIEVYEFKLLKQVDNNAFEFEVACSSGTYIRSLCRDLAERLSTYGVMSYIQRTRCGRFDLKDAFTLEEIKSGHFDMVNPESLFDYPKIRLSSVILNGQAPTDLPDGLYRGYLDGEFAGVIKAENRVMRFELRLV